VIAYNSYPFLWTETRAPIGRRANRVVAEKHFKILVANCVFGCNFWKQIWGRLYVFSISMGADGRATRIETFLVFFLFVNSFFYFQWLTNISTIFVESVLSSSKKMYRKSIQSYSIAARLLLVSYLPRFCWLICVGYFVLRFIPWLWLSLLTITGLIFHETNPIMEKPLTCSLRTTGCVVLPMYFNLWSNYFI